MIVVRYAAKDPHRGGVWFQHELRSDDFIVIREHHQGGFLDETLVPERAEGWAGIRYVLDGRVVTRVPGASTELGPDDAFVYSTIGKAPVRSLGTTTDFLHVLWRCSGVVGSPIAADAKLRLSPFTRASLRRVAASLAIQDPHPTRALDAVFDAFVALRTEGVPLMPAATKAARPAMTNEHDVARALERVTFPLSSQPTSINLSLALGVGEHHALRRANQHFRRFHLCMRSWRDYLRGQRVSLGTFFMGCPGARTEDVARLLGFRSPTSFCHAFHAAGLPSPRAVQRELLASRS